MLKNSMEQILNRVGLKVTKPRVLLLSTMFQDKEKCFTAQELFNHVVTVLPKTSFSTVYRNLEVLFKYNLVIKLDREGINYFRIRDQEGHSHYLVCKGCGVAKQLEYCPLEQLAQLNLEGFVPMEHKFEIYGYCVTCQRLKEKRQA